MQCETCLLNWSIPALGDVSQLEIILYSLYWQYSPILTNTHQCSQHNINTQLIIIGSFKVPQGDFSCESYIHWRDATRRYLKEIFPVNPIFTDAMLHAWERLLPHATCGEQWDAHLHPEIKTQRVPQGAGELPKRFCGGGTMKRMKDGSFREVLDESGTPKPLILTGKCSTRAVLQNLEY
jgi:hypothetical protein